MNDILAALANVATEGDITMATTLKELTSTLRSLNKKLTVSKRERKERRTTIGNFTVGLMAEPEIKIISALLATTRKKDIKMMQLETTRKVVAMNIAMIKKGVKEKLQH